MSARQIRCGSPGVIFADSLTTGEAMRDELALTDWIVVTPRSIDRLRGRIVEPRLIVVAGTGSVYAYSRDLLAAFSNRQPVMYWLTGGAL